MRQWVCGRTRPGHPLRNGVSGSFPAVLVVDSIVERFVDLVSGSIIDPAP